MWTCQPIHHGNHAHATITQTRGLGLSIPSPPPPTRTNGVLFAGTRKRYTDMYTPYFKIPCFQFNNYVVVTSFWAVSNFVPLRKTYFCPVTKVQSGERREVPSRTMCVDSKVIHSLLLKFFCNRSSLNPSFSRILN